MLPLVTYRVELKVRLGPSLNARAYEYIDDHLGDLEDELIEAASRFVDSLPGDLRDAIDYKVLEL